MRLVASVAKEVGTAVDARVEALHQQHNVDIQAYEAKIDHLKSMLASLGICELVELLPTSGGTSTSQSIQDYQYTADMFTKDQVLH